MAGFSNSAWATRGFIPTQHEEANWLKELEPAKRIEVRQIVSERLIELRGRRLPRLLMPDHARYVHKSLFSRLHWGDGDYRGTPVGEGGPLVPGAAGPKTVAAIASQMHDIFLNLRSQNYLVGQTKVEFVIQEANLIFGMVTVRPFYYGNHLVAKVIAEHVAENAGFKLDLLSVPPVRVYAAIDHAQSKGDHWPLRNLVRDQSRPQAGILFEAAIKSGDWSPIHNHPRMQPAYNLLLEAVGGNVARARIADQQSTPRERIIIGRIQTEVDAGRLREAPTGSDRDWYFGRSRSPDL